MAFPALSAAAVAPLGPRWFATGSAIDAGARQVGAVLGIAVVVAILTAGEPRTAVGVYRNAWLCLVIISVAVALGAILSRARSAPAEAASA